MLKQLTSILLFFLGMLPLIHAQSSFQKYFDEHHVTGSTTIYDYQHKRWIYTDSVDAQKGTLPASTFKILNSLIALETGVIADEHEQIKWDGKEHMLFGKPYPVWNQDTDLRTAFANSTIWFYEEMARRIGRTRYRKMLQATNYGNQDLSEKGIDFWNYGPLAISPENQINFLIRLYENDVPFSYHSKRMVKNIMVSEMDDMCVWRDKTGWAQKDGEDIGWWVGYVTTQRNVYFFATRITKSIDSDRPDFAPLRKSITKKILYDIMAADQ